MKRWINRCLTVGNAPHSTAVEWVVEQLWKEKARQVENTPVERKEAFGNVSAAAAAAAVKDGCFIDRSSPDDDDGEESHMDSKSPFWFPYVSIKIFPCAPPSQLNSFVSLHNEAVANQLCGCTALSVARQAYYVKAQDALSAPTANSIPESQRTAILDIFKRLSFPNSLVHQQQRMSSHGDGFTFWLNPAIVPHAEKQDFRQVRRLCGLLPEPTRRTLESIVSELRRNTYTPIRDDVIRSAASTSGNHVSVLGRGYVHQSKVRGPHPLCHVDSAATYASCAPPIPFCEVSTYTDPRKAYYPSSFAPILLSVGGNNLINLADALRVSLDVDRWVERAVERMKATLAANGVNDSYAKAKQKESKRHSQPSVQEEESHGGARSGTDGADLTEDELESDFPPFFPGQTSAERQLQWLVSRNFGFSSPYWVSLQSIEEKWGVHVPLLKNSHTAMSKTSCDAALQNNNRFGRLRYGVVDTRLHPDLITCTMPSGLVYINVEQTSNASVFNACACCSHEIYHDIVSFDGGVARSTMVSRQLMAIAVDEVAREQLQLPVSAALSARDVTLIAALVHRRQRVRETKTFSNLWIAREIIEALHWKIHTPEYVYRVFLWRYDNRIRTVLLRPPSKEKPKVIVTERVRRMHKEVFYSPFSIPPSPQKEGKSFNTEEFHVSDDLVSGPSGANGTERLKRSAGRLLSNVEIGGVYRNHASGMIPYILSETDSRLIETERYCEIVNASHLKDHREDVVRMLRYTARIRLLPETLVRWRGKRRHSQFYLKYPPDYPGEENFNDPFHYAGTQAPSSSVRSGLNSCGSSSIVLVHQIQLFSANLFAVAEVQKYKSIHWYDIELLKRLSVRFKTSSVVSCALYKDSGGLSDDSEESEEDASSDLSHSSKNYGGESHTGSNKRQPGAADTEKVCDFRVVLVNHEEIQWKP